MGLTKIDINQKTELAADGGLLRRTGAVLLTNSHLFYLPSFFTRTASFSPVRPVMVEVKQALVIISYSVQTAYM